MSEIGNLLCLCCSHEVRIHFKHPAKRNNLCCSSCNKRVCTETPDEFSFPVNSTVVMTDQGAAVKTGWQEWRLMDGTTEE